MDGDTSTNDTVIALASGLSGSNRISSIHSNEAVQLQACLDAVRIIAWSEGVFNTLLNIRVELPMS